MKEKQPSPAKSTPNDLNRVAQGWENREGLAVFVTVDAAKTPNAIYVGEIRYVPGEGLIVADNYFHKTRAHIKNGTRGAILFLAKERKSFQVKAPLACHTGGPIFQKMQTWRDPKHPGGAATLLRIEEAYSGAEKLL